ncbi:MAG: hypothetical protein U5L11_02625 [Arhodomonas sp.]|nr:hypothetical protein [Arhodomonas sp.]
MSTFAPATQAAPGDLVRRNAGSKAIWRVVGKRPGGRLACCVPERPGLLAILPAAQCHILRKAVVHE